MVVGSTDINRYFQAFKSAYLETPKGKEHRSIYYKEREEVATVFQRIKEKQERGEDITQDVLYKLLPYVNNEPNRMRGYRVSNWGFIIKDVKMWFEGAGWQQSENWSSVSQAIFKLINDLIKERKQQIIDNFKQSEYSTGFQAGMISPILFCLDAEFLPINNKTVDTVNFLSGTDLIDSRLENYLENIQRLKEFIKSLEIPEFSDYCVFDMFCHWMCDKKLGGYARGELGEEPPEIPLVSVSLEKDLRDHLAGNPTKIEKGLKLVGKEYPTDVGKIDILCEDRKGNLVVIETKKGRESDKVVGQVLRYMGWLKKEKGKNVRGIIITAEPDEKLDYAILPLPAVNIKYYRVKFDITDRYIA